MTRYISYILLLALTFQITGKVIVCVQYEWNKEYIAAELCENRDKPSMHCDGKCYLNQQLEKKENQEGSSRFGLKEKGEWQIHCALADLYLSAAFSTGCHKFLPYRVSETRECVVSIFRPPSC